MKRSTTTYRPVKCLSKRLTALLLANDVLSDPRCRSREVRPETDRSFRSVAVVELHVLSDSSAAEAGIRCQRVTGASWPAAGVRKRRLSGGCHPRHAPPRQTGRNRH